MKFLSIISVLALLIFSACGGQVAQKKGFDAGSIHQASEKGFDSLDKE